MDVFMPASDCLQSIQTLRLQIFLLAQIDWKQHAENWSKHVKKNDPETGTSNITRCGMYFPFLLLA